MAVPVQLHAFRQALSAGDAFAAEQAAREATSAGVTLLTVYEHLTAVLEGVGQRWERGALGVADEHEVTAAASTVVARLRGAPPAASRGAVLLMTPPGEQHTLGVAVLQHLFEQAQLRAKALPDLPWEEAARAAAGLPGLVAVVVSLHLRRPPEDLRSGIQLLRRAAPGAQVVLGGPAFALEGTVANRQGADYVLLTAGDALAAVLGALGPLSRRELDVLHGIAAGLTTKVIAERLVLSAETVKQHTASLLHKLEAPSRAAAVANAFLSGLLRPGSERSPGGS